MTNENILFAGAGIIEPLPLPIDEDELAEPRRREPEDADLVPYARTLYDTLVSIARAPMSLREIRLAADKLVRRIESGEPPSTPKKPRRPR
jgi:hypothetical protein